MVQVPWSIVAVASMLGLPNLYTFLSDEAVAPVHTLAAVSMPATIVDEFCISSQPGLGRGFISWVVSVGRAISI